MKCEIAVSLDYAFTDKWKRTIGETAPRASVVEKVEKEQYFYIYLFCMEYGLDAKKNAHIIFDIVIINPDQEIFLDETNVTAVVGEISNPSIMLSEEVFKICFDPKDKLGTYLIQYTIKDLVSNELQKIEKKINLIGFRKEDYIQEEKDLEDWMINYYLNPSPEKAISGFIFWTTILRKLPDSAFPPIFSFFLEVYNKNPYLIPYLQEMYISQDSETKQFTIYFFIHLNHDFKDFFGILEGEELAIYQKYNAMNDSYDPYLEITGVQQIDLLWGIFSASGKYKPIRTLVDVLKLCKYKGAIEKFQSAEKPTEEMEQLGLYDILYRTVKWSIGSNCKQHQLVLDYCKYVYQNEELTNEVKAELKEIIFGESKE